jgi:hypothetical protein
VTATPATTVTSDELVSVALERLEWAAKGLDKPLTVARIHAIRGHIAAATLALLTEPVRPTRETPDGR